jgi:Cu(I)/Ag(I) efflux system membrane protein CusA/SilA
MPEDGCSVRRLLAFFLDSKLVVAVLVGGLLLAGLRVAPFEGLAPPWLPRDPVPVDAIPDVGEQQQIVFTEWAGRSPRDVEDQVTYPLTTALLSVPGVRTVRATSALGFSTVSVIFEDGVDFYWARSRILERLASLPRDALPLDATPTLGPDATALGQVFWYTLEGQDADGRTVGGWDLHELRRIQDFRVRYALQSVEGVAEVASVGGHVQEVQVDVDPDALAAHDVSLTEVADAVRASNLDVSARTLEINRVEYVVRGLGDLADLADLEQIVVAERDGAPLRVRDVAQVHLGPGLRRGGLDDAGAEVVGGVVVARFGANPREVLTAVRQRLDEIAPGLPRRTLEDGTESRVTVVPFYDRTELIDDTVQTLASALWLEILVTVLVLLVLLRHLPGAVAVSAMLPLGVLLALVAMRVTGVEANVMALGGIAIAIGTMVDMSIVVTENIAQHLRTAPAAGRRDAVLRGVSEVGPAVVTSALTTIVGFLPVFGLTAAEARLFGPLALTKTFAMLGALLLALFVLPAVADALLRPAGRRLLDRARLLDVALVAAGIALAFSRPAAGLVVAGVGVLRLSRPLWPEGRAVWGERAERALAVVGVTVALALAWAPLGPSPVANVLFVGALLVLVLGGLLLFLRAYPTLLRWALAHKVAFSLLPAGVVLFGLFAWLGAPTLLPATARQGGLGQTLARAFPGLGREYMPPFDEGAFLYMPTTMPHASVGQVREMLATIDASIAAIPEVDRVVGKWGRAESALDPAPASMIETVVTLVPEYRTLDDGRRVRQWRDEIRTSADIWDAIAEAAAHPGLTGAPRLMPIGARIVMLQSGIRAPMGVRLSGPDLESLEAFGAQVEATLRRVPELRAETVLADRIVGKPYLEIELDREALGRFGLTVAQVQRVLRTALGGEEVTQILEGRARHAVRVRYMREERGGVEALGRVRVPTRAGPPVPLSQLSELRYVRGPQAIRSEDTFPVAYVVFDRDPEVAEVEAVEAARGALEEAIEAGRLTVPEGVRFAFTGTYEAHVRSESQLRVLVPLALALVLLLLHLQFRRPSTSAIVFSAVAVAVAGGFGLLWLYGQPWFLDVPGLDLRGLFRVGTTNVSTAVWVGVIALVGIATDDGVVLATYLKQRFEAQPPGTVAEVREAVREAAWRRVRPCLMTTATTLLALLPVISAQGRGADVMAPMALPSVGGMAVELLTLFVVPVLYAAVEEARIGRRS